MASDDGNGNVHAVSARGFSLQVEAYERGRPSYPECAVHYALTEAGLLHDGPTQVLDLAAGTGKLTRLLAAHPEMRPVAAEPNKGMREGFQKVLPDIPLTSATASNLPFKDGEFDAVFVAQGFHWFANEEALREIRRVLRPGGALVLIWNREDRSSPLANDLLQIFEPLSLGIPQYWTGAWKEVWRGAWAQRYWDVQDVDARSRFFQNANVATREQIWSRILSRSYVAALAPPQQEEVKKQLESVLAKHSSEFHAVPDREGAGPDTEVAVIALRTEVFVAKRVG